LRRPVVVFFARHNVILAFNYRSGAFLCRQLIIRSRPLPNLLSRFDAKPPDAYANDRYKHQYGSRECDKGDDANYERNSNRDDANNNNQRIGERTAVRKLPVSEISIQFVPFASSVRV
jgi:hypothetical protein